MDIKTEQQINGAAACYLRNQAGKNQRDFWTSLGITQSGGSRYENSSKIPKPLRTLIFIQYVAGLSVDASSEAGAAALVRLGKLQASEQADHKVEIGEKLQTVMSHVKRASDTLSTV